MQQATILKNIVNDIALFSAEQIQAFREYLEESGLQVRDSGSGQFFHVRLPELSRWLPIERGRGGVPVTPEVLRPFVTSFLKFPLGSVRSDFRAARLAAERRVPRVALAQPVGQFLEKAEAPAHAAINTVKELSSQSINAPDAREFQSLGEQRAASRALKVARAQPLSRYLSDLRDDLALHAPLVQLANESLRAFAIRRWEYADLMLATRTNMAGD